MIGLGWEHVVTNEKYVQPLSTVRRRVEMAEAQMSWHTDGVAYPSAAEIWQKSTLNELTQFRTLPACLAPHPHMTLSASMAATQLRRTSGNTQATEMEIKLASAK